MTLHAIIQSVREAQLGDALATTPNAGDTFLQVYDTTDFDEDGGWLSVAGGTPIAYTTIDDDLAQITLAAPWAGTNTVDAPVFVWDQNNNQPASTYVAVVDSVDGFDGQPLEATVDQSLVPALAQYGREMGQGESVTLTHSESGEMTVTALHGRQNAVASVQQLQGGFTTRAGDDQSGVEILGTDAGTPGIWVYGTGGVQQMLVSSDGIGGVFKFWTGDPSETGPGYVNPAVLSGKPAVDIASPQTSAGQSRIRIWPDEIYLNSDVLADTFTSTGVITANAGVNVFGSGNTVSLSAPPTTTSAANVNINSVNGNLRTVTSLSEHKFDQQPLSSEAVRGVLRLTPITWFDRAEVEANGGKTTGLRRVAGVTAEDVEKHAPQLAEYDADGNLQGVAYDRLAALLLPIVRDQQERIERLERLVDHLLEAKES